MNALIIDSNGSQAVHHPLTLKALQTSVGGMITPAFTVQSPTEGRSITGYVDDEGLLTGKLMTLVLDNGSMLAGPCVITALDDDGETQPLNGRELAWLRERITLLAQMEIENEHGDFVPAAKLHRLRLTD